MPGPLSHKATNLPYIKNASSADVKGDVGGLTLELIAAAELKLGETVILTAADTVNKSTGTAEKFIGVVVGGTQTYGYVVTDASVYGTKVAAALGEMVIVLVQGVTYIIADAAIAVATNIVPDTATAGRIKAAGAAARGNGILLEASTGANDIAKAYLF